MSFCPSTVSELLVRVGLTRGGVLVNMLGGFGQVRHTPYVPDLLFVQ
jgi:hypothetical protein